MSEFPVYRSGDTVMEFRAGSEEFSAPPFAALVMAWQEDRVLVCDIAGRGWTIPSGRIESGESPEEAARRELMEEAGAEVGPFTLLGTFHISNGGCESLAVVFNAEVTGVNALPPGTESRGARFVHVSELPAIYSFWNPMTEAVFQLAARMRS